MPQPTTVAETEALIVKAVRRAMRTPAPKAPKQKRVQQIVLVETARYYGVTVRHLRTSTARGATTESRIMCILLLGRHAGIPVRGIAVILGVTPNLVSKRLRAFALALKGNRDEKIYGQEEFIEKFRAMSAAIRAAKRAANGKEGEEV